MEPYTQEYKDWIKYGVKDYFDIANEVGVDITSDKAELDIFNAAIIALEIHASSEKELVTEIETTVEEVEVKEEEVEEEVEKEVKEVEQEATNETAKAE